MENNSSEEFACRVAEACHSPAESGAAGREHSLTAEQQHTILRKRAADLARKPLSPPGITETIEIVEFLLAHERYGIESTFIHEVHTLTYFTPIPCTPPFVLGITNIHGKIFSIVDLRRFFDLPDKGLTDLSKVIVLSNQIMEYGILADTILGVSRVPAAELQISLPTLTEVRADYLRGITRERVVVLDGAKLLAEGRLVVHEEVV